VAQNVEIKARIHDPDAMADRVEAISGSPGELIVQQDIFFP